MRTLNIVAEREECIRTYCHIAHLIQPCTFLFSCEHFRFHLEDFLPCTFCQNIHIFLTNVYVNRIVSVCTANTVYKLKAKYFRRLTKEPVICFLACQTGTMYTGLLSCSNTDCLSAFYETYRVGLCIFQRDQRNLHIDLGSFRKIFVLGYDIGNQFIVDCQFLSSLLKCHTEYFFVLDWSRFVVLINLDDIVIAVFLLFENLQCLLCISRSNHTVGNLSLNQRSGIFVADIRQRNKITKGRHSVCTSRSRICTCDRREISHIIHPVNFLQYIIHRETNCGTCRRYMFKRSSCRKTCCLFQLTHQLPSIESIQEVDISRSSAEHLNRKFGTVCHINSGRFLIWVASIF